MDENRTFGIEIELHARIDRGEIARRIERAFRENDCDHHCSQAGYRHDTDQHNFHYWFVKSDSSITRSSNSSITRTHGTGAEVISPILKGSAGLKVLKIVCEVLDTDDFRVSRTCGLHVHHGVNKRTDALWKFVNSWIDCEKYFMKIVPPSRQSNYYCRPWAVHFRETSWSGRSNDRHMTEGDSVSTWNSNNIESRYATVNLRSISVRNTVEFRMHSGTTEFKKVKNWIIITQAFLNASFKAEVKATSFDTLMEKIKTLANSNGNVPTLTNNSLFNQDAKKQKLPRDGSKLRLIADMLITGSRKDQIVRALNDNFGHNTKSHRTQVTCKIADFQTLKYGFGWKINKSSTGKYQVSVGEIEPDDVEPIPGESDNDINLACEWMHERFELFN